MAAQTTQVRSKTQPCEFGPLLRELTWESTRPRRASWPPSRRRSEKPWSCSVVHRCVFVLLAACGGRGPAAIRSTQACDPAGHPRVVAATTAAELTAALAGAR